LSKYVLPHPNEKKKTHPAKERKMERGARKKKSSPGYSDIWVDVSYWLVSTPVSTLPGATLFFRLLAPFP
jgi:hypothetical protein